MEGRYPKIQILVLEQAAAELNFSEESFLNHSSIAGLSRNYESEDSINRVQELNRRNTLMPQFESYVPNKNNKENAPNRVVELSRRNTLCMPHLRSCYPAEGVPLNPPNKHLSKYVDHETFESALRDCELGTRTILTRG